MYMGGGDDMMDSLIRDIPLGTYLKGPYLILSVTSQYGSTLVVKVKYCDFVHSFLNLRVYGISGDTDEIIWCVNGEECFMRNLPFMSLISYRELRYNDAALFVNWHWMSGRLKGILFGR